MTTYRKRYQYKGYFIETFIHLDLDKGSFYYTACVELLNNKGVIECFPKNSRNEAEFAAEELIDSWN